jgi:signal transduction histidine kinase
MGLRELLPWRGTTRLTARQIDWLAVSATVAVGVLKVVHEAEALHGHLLAALVLLPFATLPLLWRRTYPGAVLLVLGAVFAAALAIDQVAPSNVGLLFALYAAARYGSATVRKLSGVAAALITGTPLVMLILNGTGTAPRRLTISLAIGMGAAWLLGEVTRTRQAHLSLVEERAERLARDRGEHARRAAEQERMRIARELHDVVTHNVSVIALHADAADTTARSHPERAHEALVLIQHTARDTLQELRSLLGVLRIADGSDAQLPLRPAPSIAHLEELLERTRAGGVEVAIRVVGTPVALDAASDLAAFRVVQESLTNTARHAPGATADVRIEYSPHELELSVRSAGGRPLKAKNPPGYGLIGLQERMQVIGGELQAGSDPTGFCVRARIPLGPRVRRAELNGARPRMARGAASSDDRLRT